MSKGYPRNYPRRNINNPPPILGYPAPRGFPQQYPPPQQEPSKKIWLFLGIFIVLIIVVLFIFLFMRSSSTLTNDELSQGTSINLKPNNEINFEIDNKKYKIILDAIYTNSVNIVIQSSTITESLEVGETKKFDLDNDGEYDLKVRLIKIENGRADLFIQEIDESICIEDWDCTDWSLCVNGQQTRICEDSNSCGTIDDKPNEQQSCILQALDCGSSILTEETIGNTPNFDCFIEASENCEPAKLLSTSTIELFGLLITTATNIELKGIESNKCIYYQKTINQTVAFTDELVQQMLDGGATQEEIDQQEQTANDNVKLVWGLERTCKFNTEDLTFMLNRWKVGSSSTEDFDVAECEGDY